MTKKNHGKCFWIDPHTHSLSMLHQHFFFFFFWGRTTFFVRFSIHIQMVKHLIVLSNGTGNGANWLDCVLMRFGMVYLQKFWELKIRKIQTQLFYTTHVTKLYSFSGEPKAKEWNYNQKWREIWKAIYRERRAKGHKKSEF